VVRKSKVIKRAVTVDGRKTSVSLEDVFWSDLGEIARSRNMTVGALITTINQERQQSNLSSTLRLFVLSYYRKQIAEHKKTRSKGLIVEQYPLIAG
jgi:predicted DNA-binding ribbon-helix-helix protein